MADAEGVEIESESVVEEERIMVVEVNGNGEDVLVEDSAQQS